MPDAPFHDHPVVQGLNGLIDRLTFMRECGEKTIQVDDVVWKRFITPRSRPVVATTPETPSAILGDKSTSGAQNTLDLTSQTTALNALNQTILACEKCPLHVTCTKRLVGQGKSYQPDILVVNGMTSAQDIDAGVILSGAAGELFDKMLTAIGLDRSTIYLTSACKCTTPNGKRDDVALDSCSAYLAKEIELVNPKVIVMLGPVAVKGTFSGSQVGFCDTIGHWHLWRERYFAVTIHHPARIQILPEQLSRPLKRDTWNTLKSVKDRLTTHV